MRPARCEPDERISGGNAPAIDRQGFLDNSDGESGEVVFAGHERVRMLGGFTADECATGLLAARGDALDDLARHRHVEPLANVIVEEEQRLGALDQDVVDAHRDQVHADGVVAVEREGKFELGPDPVGAGDQHRFAIALGQLDQRAEPADAGQDLRAQGTLGEWLDLLDQGIARIDVHTGPPVRERSAGSISGHRIESRRRAG